MRTDRTLVVTGAIGSGKSFVAQWFVRAEWAYIDADAIGHEVLQRKEVVTEVARRWPHAVDQGVIDRALLADTVFSDADALIRLEAITHPPIRASIDKWLTTTSGLRLVEVSVLKAIDPAWGMKLVVDAPFVVRLRRLMERGLSRDNAMQRITAQPPRSDWLEAADIVIDNSGQKELELDPFFEALTR
ncbi:MAG: dephospho-CoA kinase [Acidimicrobiia bacterium]